jgi:hypothetical protein
MRLGSTYILPGVISWMRLLIGILWQIFHCARWKATCHYDYFATRK